MAGVLLPFCSIFFSGLLLIVFFSKKRISLFENKLYSLMLVCSFTDSIIVTILQLFVKNGFTELEYRLIPLLNKLDMTFVILFTICLLLYTIVIVFPNTEKIIANHLNVVFTICLILIVVLFLGEVKILERDGNFTSGGSTLDFAALISGLNLIASIIIALINIRKKDKRLIPLYTIIFILILLLIFTKINPYLIIISITITFIDYIMFYTIENPDLKNIRELSVAKKQAEKYVNEKEIFSFNMSQKIKEPIADIDEICEELEKTNNIDELKQGIKDIKLSASKIVYLVSDTISGLGTAKIDLRVNDYNVNNLFMLVNQSVKTNALKYNVTFYEGKYNKDTFVNGDDLKIKQVVSSFALQLIKLISGRSITLNTTVIPKEDKSTVSFKFIIPVIDLTLEELNKNEELEKYEDINFEQISLSKLKKLINLLDGYFEIKNINDDKMEIIINFEQKNTLIQNKESLKYIDEYEKQNKDKLKILIVDESEDKESLSRFISHLKYDVTVAKNGEECLNLIRNNHKYSLIFIDDDLDKLDTITVFDRLKSIEGFNTPVIYVGDVSNKEREEDLLNIGFSAVLLKPIKQKEIDEIIDRYVK